ncbi:MAG: hypothetical protein ACRDC4_15020 [Plesiomonas sp.]
MKIVKPRNENVKEFNRLTEGSVFEVSGKVYMKLDFFVVDDRNCNTVNLSTGKISHTGAAVQVIHHPYAELHLK